MLKPFFLILIFCGCTAASPWVFESILTGEKTFDAARLVYSDHDSPLRFEIVRLETGIEAFLSLTKYKFSDPENIKIEFNIHEEKIIEILPLLEGNMRIRFSSELTMRLIRALQEGKEIAILVDGFEQHLDPGYFVKQYEQLSSQSATFRNPFKGIFDP